MKNKPEHHYALWVQIVGVAWYRDLVNAIVNAWLESGGDLRDLLVTAE